MGQAFIEGTRIPVTYIKAGPCVVTGIKKEGKDGYWAVQLGFGEKKIKNVTKPLKGHLKGVIRNSLAPSFLREVKFEAEPKYKVGDKVLASDIFSVGDLVSVSGISKGKGFTGVVKRWGFAGGPRTHGQSDRLRAPGSIGQGTTPGRVHKGKKMAGRMGSSKVTVKNLGVVSVDPGKDEVVLSGPVPGRKGGFLVIRKIKKGSLSDLLKETPEMKVEEERPEEAEEEKKEEKKNE